MILDSSVILAVLLREEKSEKARSVIGSADILAVGAPTLAESGIVLAAKAGPSGRTLLERFVDEIGVNVLPFGTDHWGVSVSAYERFGKGRHPAGLNFGDCMTYATARLAGLPLLCLGDDFPQTDLDLVALDQHIKPGTAPVLDVDEYYQAHRESARSGPG